MINVPKNFFASRTVQGALFSALAFALTLFFHVRFDAGFLSGLWETIQEAWKAVAGLCAAGATIWLRTKQAGITADRFKDPAYVGAVLASVGTGVLGVLNAMGIDVRDAVGAPAEIEHATITLSVLGASIIQLFGAIKAKQPIETRRAET